MKVSELRGHMQKDDTIFTKSSLADVAVKGRELRFNGTALSVADDYSMGTLAKFLGIPKEWFLKLADDRLMGSILKYSLDANRDSVAMFEHTKDALKSIYHVSDRVIPRERFLEIVEKSVPKNSKVHAFEFTHGSLLVDVTVSTLKTEPRVGDITDAGLRVQGYVAPREKSPYTSTFMNRRVCTNGMTRTEEGSVIHVRGSTVDEIIEEMEEAAQRILTEHVPQRLEQYAHLTEHKIQNPDRFVSRIAREAGLGIKVVRRILSLLPSLEDNTMYDLVNLITAQQHESEVTDRQAQLLQELGGNIIATYAKERCRSCQQLL